MWNGHRGSDQAINNLSQSTHVLQEHGREGCHFIGCWAQISTTFHQDRGLCLWVSFSYWCTNCTTQISCSLLNDLPLLVSLSPVSILFLYYFCLSTIVCVAPCLLSPAATNTCVVFYLVIYYNKTYTVYIFISHVGSFLYLTPYKRH